MVIKEKHRVTRCNDYPPDVLVYRAEVTDYEVK